MTARLRRTAATRHELLHLRRRLDRVEGAADLLRRKRAMLVTELFRAAQPALEAREAIASQASLAFAALLQAESDRGQPLLRALAQPMREVALALRFTEALGLRAAEIVEHDPVRRAASDRGLAVGSAGPAAAEAATAFERLTELLLDSASRELRLRRLARALAVTSRRVNLLQRRVAPDLSAEIARIEATLDEREREDRHRRRCLRGRREQRA